MTDISLIYKIKILHLEIPAGVWNFLIKKRGREKIGIIEATQTHRVNLIRYLLCLLSKRDFG